MVIDGLNGEGARAAGGRWNSPGRACVYSSQSLALAVLEVAVHRSLMPKTPYVAFAIEIPDSIVPEVVSVNDLPRNWRRHPAPARLAVIGDSWLRRRESAVLAVPSVLVPHELNYLLNPTHPAFERIIISEPQPFEFDPRLFEPYRGG